MGWSFATLRRLLPLFSPAGEDDSTRSSIYRQNRKLKAIVKFYKISIIPVFKSNLAVIDRWINALRSGVTSIPTCNLIDDDVRKTIADLKPLVIAPLQLSDVPWETMARLCLQSKLIRAAHPCKKLVEEEEKVIEMLHEGDSLMIWEFDRIRWKSLMLFIGILKNWSDLMEHFKEVPEKTIEEMKSGVTEFHDMFNVYCCQFAFFETKFMRLTLEIDDD